MARGSAPTHVASQGDAGVSRVGRPVGRSAMPGLLLRCDCRAFVRAQDGEEPGTNAYHVLDAGRHRPFDADDLEQVVAFVSAWRRGVAKPLW